MSPAPVQCGDELERADAGVLADVAVDDVLER
jgi:hypothetical protein